MLLGVADQLSGLKKGNDLRKRLHVLKVKLDFHLLSYHSNWKPRHMKPPKTPDFRELMEYCSDNAMTLFPGRHCGRLRQDLAWTIEAKNAVYHMDVPILYEFYHKFISAIDNIDILIPDVGNL